jgi:chemotaxis protein methyltransferase WspC
MSIASITPALTQRVAFAGIDTRTMSPSRLEWIVTMRCRELGLPSPSAYLERIEHSELELDALVETLLVPETRFFRDPRVFTHLRENINTLAATTNGVLRVLSAPCSTGQEAYSIAATLLRAGLPPERFTVDAVDLSERALHSASQATYPEASMRGVTPEDRDACAVFNEDAWHIRPEVHERVRFLQHNLAQAQPLPRERYHLIFCRNLFIYFHREARKALTNALLQALDPDGWLVLGPGDLVPELAPRVTSLRPASSFTFQHATQPAPSPHPFQFAATSRAPRKPTPVFARPVPAPTAQPSIPAASELHRRALESYSANNVRLAERRCRQALYLDPEYLPALELLDKIWHSSASQRLRRALAARIHRSRTAAHDAGEWKAS